MCNVQLCRNYSTLIFLIFKLSLNFLVSMYMPVCTNVYASVYFNSLFGVFLILWFLIPSLGKVSTECQTDPVKIMRNKNEKVYCPHCTYSTTIPFNLKAHISRRHTGEKPYLCPYCAKKFSEKTDLVIHERTHNGQRPYACDICDKTFSTSMVRNRHKIRIHTEARPFVCDICYMGFKIKYDLKCHVRTHSSNVFP